MASPPFNRSAVSHAAVNGQPPGQAARCTRRGGYVWYPSSLRRDAPGATPDQFAAAPQSNHRNDSQSGLGRQFAKVWRLCLTPANTQETQKHAAELTYII